MGGGWIGKRGERSTRAGDSQRCKSSASHSYLIYLPVLYLETTRGSSIDPPITTTPTHLKSFYIPDTKSKYVLRRTTYHSDIPTWISHHLGLVGYLEYIKIPPEESVDRYEIAWIGMKDVSNPTPILYVDSSTEYGLIPSCPCVPTPKMHPDLRDCVESYAIHMILTCRLRITCVALVLSLITSKQRATSSMPLLLTEEAPL